MSHHEHAHALGHPPSEPGYEEHTHHGPYVKIWAILLALLVISVFGPFLGIRVVTLLTAFGIALVKAYMVAKNFMHLDIEKPIVHWLLATALIFMVLLFAGVAPDVMKHKGHNWKNEAAEREVKRALDAAKHAPHQAH